MRVLSIASLLSMLQSLNGMLKIPTEEEYMHLKQQIKRSSNQAPLMDKFNRVSADVVAAAGYSVKDGYLSSYEVVNALQALQRKGTSANGNLEKFLLVFDECKNIIDGKGNVLPHGSGNKPSANPLPTAEEYAALISNSLDVISFSNGEITGKEKPYDSLLKAISKGYNYGCNEVFKGRQAPLTTVGKEFSDKDSYEITIDLLSGDLKNDQVAKQILREIADCCQAVERFTQEKESSLLTASSSRQSTFSDFAGSRVCDQRNNLIPQAASDKDVQLLHNLSIGATKMPFNGMYSYPKVPTISCYPSLIPGDFIVLAALEYQFSSTNMSYLSELTGEHPGDVNNPRVKFVVVYQRYDNATELSANDDDATANSTLMMFKPHRIYAEQNSPWEGQVAFSMITFAPPANPGAGLEKSDLINYAASTYSVHTHTDKRGLLVMNAMHADKPDYILSPPDPVGAVDKICPYTKDKWRLAITRIVGPDKVVTYAVIVLVPESGIQNEKLRLSQMPVKLLRFLSEDILSRELKPL
jgi:hypothetical protein